MSARPRVLLTRRWTAEVEQYLAERFDVTVNESDTPLDAAALAAAMQSHDGAQSRRQVFFDPAAAFLFPA